MAKERIQISYHFNFDPATLTIGQITIPDSISKTVVVGEADPVVSKISSDALSDQDRSALISMMEQRVIKVGKKAQATAASATSVLSDAPSSPQTEIGTASEVSSSGSLDLF